MADIHGFGDFANDGNNNNNNNEQRRYYRAMNNNQNQNQNNNNNQNQNQFQNNNDFGNNEQIMLFGNDDQGGDPRKETFAHFLKVLCPQFTFKSFIFVIICVNVLVYIISLFPCPSKEAHSLLVPDVRNPGESLLVKLTLHKRDMQNFQIYRFVTNILMTSSFANLLMNILLLLIFGSMAEKFLKTWRCPVIYFVSGILGSIFSAHFKNNTYVGGDIGVYGLFAGYFSFCVLNWHLLDSIFGPAGKCFMFYMLLFMLIFSIIIQLMIGLDDNSINNYLGNLGGLMFGFIFTFSITPPTNPNEQPFGINYKYSKYISIGITALYFTIGLLCFYEPWKK